MSQDKISSRIERALKKVAITGLTFAALGTGVNIGHAAIQNNKEKKQQQTEMQELQKKAEKIPQYIVSKTDIENMKKNGYQIYLDLNNADNNGKTYIGYQPVVNSDMKTCGAVLCKYVPYSVDNGIKEGKIIQVHTVVPSPEDTAFANYCKENLTPTKDATIIHNNGTLQKELNTGRILEMKTISYHNAPNR